MSRSGYSDENFPGLGLYRESVDRAIRGKRGQAFLRELAAALDAMPDKSLIAEELIRDDGAVCAIGAVCKARGIDVRGVDYDNPDQVGRLVGISKSMAAELAYMNDEDGPRGHDESPGQRWVRMRRSVERRIDRSENGRSEYA